ncbi:hypothetical protein F383_34453 [Gossypium arboreum]|uniref:Uncharacterized protein n=1 Tax=Gossypium arboreum TaxID=29729 RepID=A0A0B0PSQ2_GOSAR|nr:hypothetical protein F383_34453 [Gossypium arboreum]
MYPGSSLLAHAEVKTSRRHSYSFSLLLKRVRSTDHAMQYAERCLNSNQYKNYKPQ